MLSSLNGQGVWQTQETVKDDAWHAGSLLKVESDTWFSNQQQQQKIFSTYYCISEYSPTFWVFFFVRLGVDFANCLQTLVLWILITFWQVGNTNTRLNNGKEEMIFFLLGFYSLLLIFKDVPVLLIFWMTSRAQIHCLLKVWAPAVSSVTLPLWEVQNTKVRNCFSNSPRLWSTIPSL